MMEGINGKYTKLRSSNQVDSLDLFTVKILIIRYYSALLYR